MPLIHLPSTGRPCLPTILLTALLLHPQPVDAWQEGPPDPLEELLQEALDTHPEIQAARSRAGAVGARVPQAGALPDPAFFLGLMDFPYSESDLSADGMTMFSFELRQRLPPRGLRRARERAAEAEGAAALARVAQVEWSVITRLQEAYFELLLVEGAEEVHHRTHFALEAFATSAEAAFSQGLAPQQDLLRAHTELAGIAEHLAELRQRRSAAAAEINALLSRESREPIHPVLPSRVRALLEADPGPGLLTSHLAHGELGRGFPTLAELQELAVAHRPEIEVAAQRTEAARYELEAARRARRPDLSLMASYGIRSGRPDMVSLGASVDLPLFRGRKQEQAVAEADHREAAERRQVEATVLQVRRQVAEVHADLLRAWERLILLEEGVIPQARATVESAAAAYRQGEADFLRLMEAYALLFRSEIQRAHLIADLGQELARLEAAVGVRITREEDR